MAIWGISVMLESFHFLRPFWLCSLPIWVILIGCFYRYGRSFQNGWSRIFSQELLNYFVDKPKSIGHSRFSSTVFLVFSLLAGAIAILVMAGPVWKELPHPALKKTSAYVLVLDLSRSMNAEDVKPSRLVRAKQKIEDWLNLNQEGQTGLVVFAGSAFDVIPLTSDRKAILSVLSSLEPSMMPTQGSRASTGLLKALNMLNRGKINQGDVVLITDGADAPAKQVASKLAQAGHRLFVLGVGTEQGGPVPLKDEKIRGFLKDHQGNIVIPKLETKQLFDLAREGGGHYRTTRLDDDDLRSFLSEQRLDRMAMEDLGKPNWSKEWQEDGVWFLLLLLPLILPAFRRGFLMTFFLFSSLCFIDPQPLIASEGAVWKRWFLTEDQQAQRYLKHKEYKKSADLFKDRQWRSAALYRAGEYEKSAKVLQEADTADALYNRGNANARLGKLEIAIDDYKKALALMPEHEDAKFNLSLVENALRNAENTERQDSQEGENKKEDKGQNQRGQEKKENPSQGAPGKANENKNQGIAQQDNIDREKQSHKNNSQNSSPANSAEGKSDESSHDTAEESRQPGENDQALEAYKDALKEKNKPSSHRKQHYQDEPQHAKKEQEKQENFDTRQLEQWQAQQTWMRKIPDDPGGLLRRKFQYQYQQQATGSNNKTEVRQAW